MTKNLLPLLLIVFMIGCATGNDGKHPAAYVVLISIDGSRPDFYQDESWPAPHLQHLKKEGVYADKGIKSVFPSVTYPSHTTIVTGAYPAKHGVYYNTPFEAEPGHWYWGDHYITTATLWDAVKRAGMTSAAVMWPVTVDAPIDYNFPVRRPEKGEEGNQLTVTLSHVTPESLIDDFEKKINRELMATDFSHTHHALDKTVGKLSNYIIQTYKPNLVAIHFTGVDHMEHAYGREGKPVEKAIAVVDSLIGIIFQTIEQAGLKDSTAVIITGDHGFADTKAYIAPNVYLAKHGLITSDGWKAKFCGAGGSAFLYVNSKNTKAIVDSVNAILSGLPEPQGGLFRIVDRQDLDKMGANPEVALALATKEGVVVRNRSTGDSFGPIEKGGSHGYDPSFPDLHTGFIAVGAGIGKHENITGMGIKDIAPLVTKLLGLSFNSPDGVLIPGILAGDQEKNN